MAIKKKEEDCREEKTGDSGDGRFAPQFYQGTELATGLTSAGLRQPQKPRKDTDGC